MQVEKEKGVREHEFSWKAVKASIRLFDRFGFEIFWKVECLMVLGFRTIACAEFVVKGSRVRRIDHDVVYII